MRKWLEALRPNPWLARRLVAVLALAAVSAGAFCWGRYGVAAESDVQNNSTGPETTQVANKSGQAGSEYQRRVVAYLYDDIPVTREELGEFLIARFGAERVEFLVNRKIVEMACKSKGIVISDAEVEAQLRQYVKAMNMTEEIFAKHVLREKYNKTLYEFKEDVIRPKLAMMALVRPTIVVTPDDVQKEFDARYGPRVQCRMIVMQKDFPKLKQTALWEKVRKSEEAFLEEAGHQYIPELASRKGDVPPIHKFFPNVKIEQEAFSLKPGEVSSIILDPETGTSVILRCEKHIPEDKDKHIENERLKLRVEIESRKMTLSIDQTFDLMRRQANPRIVLITDNQRTVPVVSSGKQEVPPPVVH